MLYERIPLKEYARIADNFNPTEFDARQWAETARKAGMRYVIITAKHHDGFAMYNSPSSSYNIVTCTPWGKDPMKELAEACRREGLKFGPTGRTEIRILLFIRQRLGRSGRAY